MLQRWRKVDYRKKQEKRCPCWNQNVATISQCPFDVFILLYRRINNILCYWLKVTLVCKEGWSVFNFLQCDMNLQQIGRHAFNLYIHIIEFFITPDRNRISWKKSSIYESVCHNDCPILDTADVKKHREKTEFDFLQCVVGELAANMMAARLTYAHMPITRRHDPCN